MYAAAAGKDEMTKDGTPEESNRRKPGFQIEKERNEAEMLTRENEVN